MPVPAGSGGVGWPPTTPGLTLAYDSVLSRVRIGVVGIPSTVATVSVERRTAGTTWATVRGGLAITPSLGAASLDDYEFSPDVTNEYRVRAWTAAGREVGPILNANPYVETDASGWTGNGASVAQTTAQAHLGSGSLAVTPAGGTTAEARTDRFAADAGADHLVTSWVRDATGWASGHRAGTNWYDAISGGSFISSTLSDVTVLTAGVWTQITATVTAPVGAVAGLLLVNAAGTPSAGDIYWVDDATVCRLDAGPMYSGQITPSLAGEVWLKSLARPFLNRTVEVADFSDVTRPSRGGTFDIVGRSYPVAVTDVRGSRRWTLTTRTRTTDDATALDLLAAAGDILLIQVPPDAGRISAVPSGYVSIGDVRVTTPPTYDLLMRVQEWQCTEVAAPGPDVVGATSTWQTVLNTYSTWQELIDAQATWADVLELVGSPADVIVS